MDSIPFIVSPFCSLSYPLDTPLIPFRCGQLAANQTVVLAFCLRTISSPRRETRDLSTWEQPAGYGMAGLQGLIGTGQFPWTFMPWKYLSIYPWIHDYHPGFDFWSFPPLSVSTSKAKGDTWKGEELPPWPAACAATLASIFVWPLPQEPARSFVILRSSWSLCHAKLARPVLLAAGGRGFQFLVAQPFADG